MKANDANADQTTERRHRHQDEHGQSDAAKTFVGEGDEAGAKPSGDRHERRDPKRAVPPDLVPDRLRRGHVGEDDGHNQACDDLCTRRPEGGVANCVQHLETVPSMDQFLRDALIRKFLSVSVDFGSLHSSCWLTGAAFAWTMPETS